MRRRFRFRRLQDDQRPRRGLPRMLPWWPQRHRILLRAVEEVVAMRRRSRMQVPSPLITTMMPVVVESEIETETEAMEWAMAVEGAMAAMGETATSKNALPPSLC